MVAEMCQSLSSLVADAGEGGDAAADLVAAGGVAFGVALVRFQLLRRQLRHALGEDDVAEGVAAAVFFGADADLVRSL